MVCGCSVKYKLYDEGVDCYFCGVCNKWLESQCTDANCGYCVDRRVEPLSKEQQVMYLKIKQFIDENRKNELILAVESFVRAEFTLYEKEDVLEEMKEVGSKGFMFMISNLVLGRTGLNGEQLKEIYKNIENLKV